MCAKFDKDQGIILEPGDLEWSSEEIVKQQLEVLNKLHNLYDKLLSAEQFTKLNKYENKHK